MYVSVLLAGMFVFSAQVLVYAYVGQVYPAAARGTALGGRRRVGRLGAITGPFSAASLLTAGIAYPWGFYVFAVWPRSARSPSLVNRDPAPDEPMPVTEEEAEEGTPPRTRHRPDRPGVTTAS